MNGSDDGKPSVPTLGTPILGSHQELPQDGKPAPLNRQEAVEVHEEGLGDDGHEVRDAQKGEAENTAASNADGRGTMAGGDDEDNNNAAAAAATEPSAYGRDAAAPQGSQDIPHISVTQSSAEPGRSDPPQVPDKEEAADETLQSEPVIAAPEMLRRDTAGTSRRSSVTSTSSTAVHSRSSLSSLNRGSAVFVISALEQIGASKEAKGSKDPAKALREATGRALEMVRSASQAGSGHDTAPAPGAELDPRVVFEPLGLACQTRSTPLIITALDCLGKLVSYSFFVEDVPATEGDEALADVVTSTVCDTFHEGIDEKVQPQIIKALVAVVLSTTVHVHQSSLLKAVRTVYNIFINSRSTATQAVAQGVLTQMVHHVFGRVPRSPAAQRRTEHLGRNSSHMAGTVSGEKAAELENEVSHDDSARKSNGQAPSVSERTAVAKGTEGIDDAVEEEIPLNDGTRKPMQTEAGGAATESTEGPADPTSEKVTLRTLESRASFEGASERDTGAALMQQQKISQEELFVKDAFLVLRALCKLSMKPLTAESERDLKSLGMRSKLLSLHLILTILRSHTSVFSDPAVIIHSATTGEQTPFVHAVKQYLCLSLSRNAVSSVNQVFEISCEIFWLVLSGMRTRMKKEIEVLINEIFLPILEMRNATAKQKSILMSIFIRLCRDPQALVEIYLNYDCDRTALDNIYERLINVLSKLSQSHVVPGTASVEKESASTSSSAPQRESGLNIPPTLSTASASEAGVQELSQGLAGQPVEVRLKRQSLESLCSVLRSLVIWSGKAAAPSDEASQEPSVSTPRASLDARGASSAPGVSASGSNDHVAETAGSSNGTGTPHALAHSNASAATPDYSRVNTPELPQDDPSRFESAKERKTMLMEGIKRFNYKPKRGIDFLVKQRFVRSREPVDIARFLLYTDGLNKAQIGEFLGEGDAENIAIMHAFADLINFEQMPFTDALRKFLHAFRLPGESQKIDRFMLKFAERFVKGNPGTFANADTAYVFAYSVVMLNTDAHNPQVKHRMTLQDFIKNNSGIDDGKNLAEEYLAKVYEEIQDNEIKMKDEVAPVAGPAQQGASGGFANAIAAVGRDLQREAYVLQTETMANKTEALFRTMVRAQRRVHPAQRAATEQFYSASHFEHVRPMFEVAWMAFLTGISGPLQESDDPEVVSLCLDAFKDAIRIVCLFGLELERNAFVTTLAKFTFLNNLGEMKSKNIEAIKALLGIAQTEGNYLKGSWREVLTCVSQLERFQLISGGVDERSLPELGRRQASTRTTSARSATTMPTEDVVQAGASAEVTVAADRVFSSTPQLSGAAIVDFVQSLSDVSWEEIQSSGMSSDNPRLFSLQKLVEISYYNMNRIRMEWSNIWLILGNHFNAVCTHPNGRVSSFGLDSLRQLSNRFLEKEELPHFKFQKDFLKPFEYTMRQNRSSEAKELVLQCLQQMMASRIHNLRSGWRTLFGTLGAASKASERVASYAFELVRQLHQDHFGEVIKAGAFADLTVCLTDFAKASHAQRLALQSVSMLRGVVPKMLAVPECPIDADTDPGPAATTPMSDDPMVRFWFPALFGFYDIIMNGDDLEVRRVALDSLFEILKRYGSGFRLDFWDTVCQEVLFPIFAVLRSRSDVSRFSTQEDMSVWLSTTMIQALRHLIDLWTHYFQLLERILPGLLDLLCACICQENDTLARIGTSCLQTLLERNVRKLSNERWGQVVDSFVQLYRTTTATQLFDPALRSEHVATSPVASRSSISMSQESGPAAPGVMHANPLSPDAGMSNRFSEEQTFDGQSYTPMTQSARRRAFKQIIVKCVLQLLLIETTNELLSKGLVYDLIPPQELLRLMGVLEDSFRFSKKFNADKDLRTALWKVGFMRQLPNLLKQESSSASTLVHILVKMHRDTRGKMKAMVSTKLVPLSRDILASYLPLDPETQARNIAAWTPVVIEVLSGVCGLLESLDVSRGDANGQHGNTDGEATLPDGMDKEGLVQIFYPLAVDLLGRGTVAPELATVLHEFFHQAGFCMRIMTTESERTRKRHMRESRERERVDRVHIESPLMNGTSSSSSSSKSMSTVHIDAAPAEPLVTHSHVQLGGEGAPLDASAVYGNSPTDGNAKVGGTDTPEVLAPTPPVISQEAANHDPMHAASA